MNIILAIVLMIVLAAAGVAAGYWYRKNMAEKNIGSAEELSLIHI